MTGSTLAPLHIPEIALSIFSHLDPPAILAIRLVCSSINTLILTHQKSLSKSVAARYFSQTIDWCPPDIDFLPENFHLKTLTRLPKAFELARRANTNCECHIETACLTRTGKRRKRRVYFKPSPSLPAFLARCARAILIIWVLNDIRQHCGPYQPLPTYIYPRAPPRGLSRLERLFSRLTSFTSKRASSAADANARSISLYLNTLALGPESEVQSYLSAFDTAAQTYLKSLPRSHRLDLFWVQEHLFINLPRIIYNHSGRIYPHEMSFALRQNPGFLLSWCSVDRDESGWAQELASQLILAREGLSSLEEWEDPVPLLLDEEDLWEEAKMVKEGLTRGDWRHGNVVE